MAAALATRADLLHGLSFLQPARLASQKSLHAQITTVVLAERVDPLAVQYASVTRAATAAIAPQAKFYCLPVAYAQPMPLPKS